MSAAAQLTLPPRHVPVLNSNPAARQGTPQDPSTAVMNLPWYLALQALVTFLKNTGTGGVAGGDLSGTFPNPTVVGLQTVPVSSTMPVTADVLTFNGTLWIPQAPSVTPGAVLEQDLGALSVATTNIIASVLPAPANGCLAVKFQQDATGGRLVTWDAGSFLFSPGQSSVKPHARATYMFTADVASGLWELASPPAVHS